jgi:hypothetical protein
MERYDPAQAPDPAQWNALSESARLALIEDYHRRARISLPDVRVHAGAHMVVENQAALGDELPVRRAIQRLMGGGLDRHEAVHAVASVLTNALYDLLKNPDSAAVDQERYNAAVERLTAERWRRTLASGDGGTSAPRGPAKPRRRLFRG